MEDMGLAINHIGIEVENSSGAIIGIRIGGKDMTSLQIYVAVGILALALVFIGLKKAKPKRLSILAAVAFGFIVAGIVFGDNRIMGYRIIGYSLFLIGISLSIVDAYLKTKK